jgi:hypothetical protein
VVWTGAENLASTGIRSLDRPTRSESLYRLSYRGPYRNTSDGERVFILSLTRHVSYISSDKVLVVERCAVFEFSYATSGEGKG